METDDDRKLMSCRSCGNTYDYDYFSEENLLKAADKALADDNYSAAKDMYSFMLDKEPSNVKALKGLLLANNRVGKLYDITLKIKKGTFIPGNFNLEKYRTGNSPEATAFFERTDKVLALYKEYLALKKTGENLETEEDSAENKLDEGGRDLLFYYESEDKLRGIVIGASVFLVCLVICTLVFSYGYDTPAWIIPTLVVAMVVTVIVILAALLRMRGNKKEPENPVLSELDGIDAKQEENKIEMHRVIGELNAVFKEMNSL